jgi:hypothetical protein
MDEMTIGAFAQRSRLSPKARRLYAELRTSDLGIRITYQASLPVTHRASLTAISPFRTLDLGAVAVRTPEPERVCA